MAIWADYSGGYPGAASLAAAGFTGAIRYIGEGGPGKLLTAVERADFDAHGFPYLLVCEFDIHDAEGGYGRGQQFAVDSLADARYKGVPDSIPIACAADEHLTLAQIPTAVEFARGFRDTIGQARTGSYGFSEFVAAVHAAGIGSWFWQSGSTPAATGTAGFVDFWQRNGSNGLPTTKTVNGVQCDINDQLLPLTASSVSTSAEDDSMGFWAVLSQGGKEAGSGYFSDSTDFLGLPVPASVRQAGAYCNLNDGTDDANALGRWQDLVTRYGKNSAAAGRNIADAMKSDGVGTVTVDPAVVQAAVTAAVKGLSLSVSDADRTAIAAASANAVVTTLAAKLSTPKAA